MRRLAHILWALFFAHQKYFNFRFLNNPQAGRAIYLVRANYKGDSDDLNLPLSDTSTAHENHLKSFNKENSRVQADISRQCVSIIRNIDRRQSRAGSGAQRVLWLGHGNQ
jgi:hypothetical protein